MSAADKEELTALALRLNDPDILRRINTDVQKDILSVYCTCQEVTGGDAAATVELTRLIVQARRDVGSIEAYGTLLKVKALLEAQPAAAVRPAKPKGASEA